MSDETVSVTFVRTTQLGNRSVTHRCEAKVPCPDATPERVFDCDGMLTEPPGEKFTRALEAILATWLYAINAEESHK